ncbi:hypothetical protein SeLEV6574_g04746 [Synchytrium endobioticum]|uniref:PARP catalytic domain-containing protein n=1 Tax=Synchytrium endobioticum TaxID=286115 RepID=A0A507CXU0_9FUNG|nr:hypothetical protein SeLEV6574_g04746 [Synchytrium endobioticum]
MRQPVQIIVEILFRRREKPRKVDLRVHSFAGKALVSRLGLVKGCQPRIQMTKTKLRGRSALDADLETLRDKYGSGSIFAVGLTVELKIDGHDILVVLGDLDEYPNGDSFVNIDGDERCLEGSILNIFAGGLPSPNRYSSDDEEEEDFPFIATFESNLLKNIIDRAKAEDDIFQHVVYKADAVGLVFHLDRLLEENVIIEEQMHALQLSIDRALIIVLEFTQKLQSQISPRVYYGCKTDTLDTLRMAHVHDLLIPETIVIPILERALKQNHKIASTNIDCLVEAGYTVIDTLLNVHKRCVECGGEGIELRTLLPTVCTNELCRFRWMMIDEARETERQLIHHPRKCKLLISLAHTAVLSNVLDPAPSDAYKSCQKSTQNTGFASNSSTHREIADLLDKLPSIAELHFVATKRNKNDLAVLLNRVSPHLNYLLRWIILSNLAHIEELKDESERILLGTETAGVGPPHFTQYKLIISSPEKEAEFQQEVQRCSRVPPTIFAFHGSPSKNWHSILRRGLILKGRPDHGWAYGKGIYNSLELGYSQGYAGGSATSSSQLKSSPLVVAVTEIVNDPAHFVGQGHSSFVIVDDAKYIQTRYLLVQGDSIDLQWPPTNENGPITMSSTQVTPRTPSNASTLPIAYHQPPHDKLLKYGASAVRIPISSRGERVGEEYCRFREVIFKRWWASQAGR